VLFRINRNNGKKFVKFVHLKQDYESELAVIASYSSEEALTVIEEIS
jgi:hypothetical protein